MQNNFGKVIIIKKEDLIGIVGNIDAVKLSQFFEGVDVSDLSKVLIFNNLAKGKNLLSTFDVLVTVDNDGNIIDLDKDVELLYSEKSKNIAISNINLVSDEILKRHEALNEKLAQLFESNGITNFRLTSLGNSIAFGYSMTRTTMPLLLRNYTLDEVMKGHDITLDRHSFSRSQNNNDEHVYDWIMTNIKETVMNQINRSDYSGGPTSMMTRGMTEEKLNEFYPLEMKEDPGLMDLIKESSGDMANVIVYNGLTGSFLDNVTREGRIRDMLTFGVKRDTYGLEATLKFIQANNRKNGANTQVYLCGAPNFLGLKISEIINSKLKKIAQKYANVVYVEPVKSKFFYKALDPKDGMTLEETQNIISKVLGSPDIHYDEDEHAELNNKITKAIIDNYEITASMINVDRAMYDLSSHIELENPELKGNSDYISKCAKAIIERNKPKNDDQEAEFLKRAQKYLLTRLPYDYHYVGKENIKEATKQI